MAPKIQLRTEQLRKLCQKFDVKELYLFGSATTDDFSEESDLDFIVKFDRKDFEGAFRQFMDFKQSLERIYGRSVDLYHGGKFRNPLFQQEVDNTKQLLYAA
jgi:predicted nucleotidyltransferase